MRGFQRRMETTVVVVTRAVVGCGRAVWRLDEIVNTVCWQQVNWCRGCDCRA